MLGSAGNARAAGFMAFRQEPLFSNHSQGTTAADQPRFDPEHAAKSRLYDATTPGHGLDLDDIAAVALLDSLSNNGAIKQHVPHAFQSSTSYAQILPPIGCGSISTATSGAMLPAGSMSINIENELQSLPGDMQTRKQHSSYNTMGNMPFSNYHITSTHTFDNERHNRSQDSLSFEQNLLFGLSQRPNSMLRTNNEFGLQSPIAQTSAPTETYILQAPQRLYTSQTRGTVMDSNGVGTNSIVHQTSNLPKHSWSSSLPGINIPFPQNGFATSNIRSDFPGALL
ncbi:hypothetical protein LPJ81_003821 [Coemansia sp. IMI 209127]|nr:hypothetical protein LPJ81_003821 [Coemansia sp. IMI 209127]